MHRLMFYIVLASVAIGTLYVWFGEPSMVKTAVAIVLVSFGSFWFGFALSTLILIAVFSFRS